MFGTSRKHEWLAALIAAIVAAYAGEVFALTKPLDVWNRDFINGDEQRGVFKFYKRGNSVDGGVVTIEANSTGGIIFEKSTTQSYPLTAVVGMSNAAYSPDANRAMILVAKSTDTDANKAYYGFYLSSDDKYKSVYQNAFPWNNSNNPSVAAGLEANDEVNYFALVHKGAAEGTGLYKNGTHVCTANGLHESGDSSGYRSVVVGGRYAAKDVNFTGAKIHYVALVNSTDSEDIAYWSRLGLERAGTDIATTDKGTGVNLPAGGNTLATEATPGAVFVQKTATITMSGNAAINLKDGNGPLYVANGATLTIDASGITAPTEENPRVTLVRGKIFSSPIAVIRPEGTILEIDKDSGITLVKGDAQKAITSPFDGSALEGMAITYKYLGTGEASVSFGNDMAAQTQVGERNAIVADVIGGRYTDINGFLKLGETANDLNKDVYLVVSGGTAARVNGVQEAHYEGTRTTRTTGSAYVQIEGNANVGYVFGAGYKGGINTDSNPPQVDGSAGVTFKGGVLTGSIVGGWTSAHQQNATVTGDTAVRIEALPATATAAAENYVPNNYIIGGSAYQANASSASTVEGNSAVTIALEEASGAFLRNIVGGSIICTAGSDYTGSTHAVQGNSSVTIKAANEVEFGMDITGGGMARVGNSVASVGGNATVSIDGGTYTGRIVAGGYATGGGTASVAGTATLELKSGVFTGATLAAGEAAGAKTLVVSGGMDISGATVEGFTEARLGEGATVQMAADTVRTASLGAGAVLRLVVDNTDVSVNGYRIETAGEGRVEYYEYVDGVLTKVSDPARLDGNNLLGTGMKWAPEAANGGGNLTDAQRWASGECPDDDAQFVVIAVNGTTTLTVDATRRFANVSVTGTGTLKLVQSGESVLTAGTIAIASGVTVEIASGAPLKAEGGGISGGEQITIDEGATLTLDGVECNTKIDCSGTLNTYGETDLKSENNIFQFNKQSVFNIESGTTKATGQATGYNGLAGTINIKAGATLAVQRTDTLTYNKANVEVNVWGTLAMGNKRWTIGTGANNVIKLHDGAEVTGEGDGNGALNWNLDGVGKLVTDGNASLKGTVKIKDTLEICVAEGKTLTVAERGTTATSGKITKTGAGTLDVAAKMQLRNTGVMTVQEGLARTDQATPAASAIVIEEGATFALKNVSWTGEIGDKFSGAGTLFLDAAGGNWQHSAVATFQGKLKVGARGNGEGYYAAFNGGDGQFANRPALEFAYGSATTSGTPHFYLDGAFNDKSLTVSDLSGIGNICVNRTANSNAFDTDTTSGTHTIDTLQKHDTIFAGSFFKRANDTAKTGLAVRGETQGDMHSLTLTGASTTQGPLTVQDNAKVVFSGAGAWQGGTVTVGEGGGLEISAASTAANVAGGLVLEAGAEFIPAKAVTLAAGGVLTLPASGTVKVNLTGMQVTDEGVALVNYTTLANDGERDVNDVFETTVPTPVVFFIEDSALKVRNLVISDEDGKKAGYVISGIAVVTDFESNVTIPSGLGAAQIALAGDWTEATLTTDIASDKIVVVPIDANGAPNFYAQLITSGFTVTDLGEGVLKVTLDAPAVEASDDAAPFAVGEGGVPVITFKAVPGLWYGIGYGGTEDGEFAIDTESIKQAGLNSDAGFSLTGSAASAARDNAGNAMFMFYKVKAATSKAGILAEVGE